MIASEVYLPGGRAVNLKSVAVLCVGVWLPGCAAVLGAQEFVCAAAHGAAKGLTAETRFDATAKTAGFDLTAAPATIAKGVCSSDKPFFFSVPATDGKLPRGCRVGRA